MEDHGRFIGILEKYLLQYIENHGENQERNEASSNYYRKTALRDLLADRLRKKFENTHRWIVDARFAEPEKELGLDV